MKSKLANLSRSSNTRGSEFVDLILVFPAFEKCKLRENLNSELPNVLMADFGTLEASKIDFYIVY